MYKAFIGVVLIATGILINTAFENQTQEVECLVHNLEDVGFVQFGEQKEYACIQTIIIVDMEDNLQPMDVLNVSLNEYGEVTAYEKR